MLLEQVLAQWWHPVASSEALDLFHRTIVTMCESGLREWKEVQINIWELKQNSKNRVLSSQVQVQI